MRQFLEANGSTIFYSIIIASALFGIFRKLHSMGKDIDESDKINPTIEDHEEQAYWKDKWRREYEYPN